MPFGLSGSDGTYRSAQATLFEHRGTGAALGRLTSRRHWFLRFAELLVLSGSQDQIRPLLDILLVLVVVVSLALLGMHPSSELDQVTEEWTHINVRQGKTYEKSALGCLFYEYLAVSPASQAGSAAY